MDHVESPYTLTDPSTGAALSPEQVAAFYAMPADQRPAPSAKSRAALEGAYVRGHSVRFDVISPFDHC